ncbi:GNAT family protein [Oceanobacillus sp. FSL K6-2867]|uniref:GNAT family N-acetyltransferase n=1 Tax=Oceanobacillus sp. FSL K6-2867 TaxID=2954748 RepID=UPI0030DA5E62
MQFTIKNMTEKYAIEVLCWKYERPYNFYNQVLTSHAIMELTGKKYYTVFDRYDVLVGFFCVGAPAQVPAGYPYGAYKEDCVDIGLGMKPAFTGRGLGLLFFSAILDFVSESHVGLDIRLTVATFNKRAIRLYEKAGFVQQAKFQSEQTEFITMLKRSHC